MTDEFNPIGDEEESMDDSLKEFKEQIISFYKKLTTKDLIIIFLIAVMVLMMVLHNNGINSCISFYEEIIKNQTVENLTFSMYQ